jgi:FliI/YscN family ATPase
MTELDPELRMLAQIVPIELTGSVAGVVGLTISAVQFPAPLGAVCRVERRAGEPLDAEVIGFRDDATLLIGYGDIRGVQRGDRVRLVSTSPVVKVGPAMLGRVFDGLGRLSDGGGTIPLPHRVSLYATPPSPMDRPRIADPLPTGVRVIDGLLTLARGQRMGIFAGSGVGKSTLLGMIARYTQADIVVVGLIGERGREVREFLETSLGAEGMKRSVIVCATSDAPALVRLKAAFTATAVAEYFRDRGRNVLLMIDSLTRLAMAQREIGLSAGEPPTTRGYPPSVFAMMPRLLERSGLAPDGSITALYTVLVEGDDTNEIVADTVRGILDGHIWLSRRLATESHFPSVDVLGSISRTMTDVVTAHHLEDSMEIKRLLAVYRENEDLISVGAYTRGSNPTLDVAIALREEILAWLRQPVKENTPYDITKDRLRKLVEASRRPQGAPVPPSPRR